MIKANPNTTILTRNALIIEVNFLTFFTKASTSMQHTTYTNKEEISLFSIDCLFNVKCTDVIIPVLYRELSGST